MRYAVILCAICAFFAACAKNEDTASDGKLSVFVGIPPIAEFVERVGGEYVTVGVLVGPGQSPHVFEPTPRLMAALSRARIYFSIGLPFEERIIEKIAPTYPGLAFVDASESVERRSMKEHEDGEEHETQDNDDAHDDGELDPHIWMSPLLAKDIAANICEGLIAADPANADAYRANLEVFQQELDAVHERIAKQLAPLRGRTMMVFHPAFGYFADTYGMRQAAVETGGREPTSRQLKQLIERARREDVRVIFVQPQFPPKAAEAVAREIGGVVVQIDPLARDYLENLERIADEIERHIK